MKLQQKCLNKLEHSTQTEWSSQVSFTLQGEGPGGEAQLGQQWARGHHHGHSPASRAAGLLSAWPWENT